MDNLEELRRASKPQRITVIDAEQFERGFDAVLERVIETQQPTIISGGGAYVAVLRPVSENSPISAIMARVTAEQEAR